MYSNAEERYPILYMRCTLAPPGEYYWTVHLRRRCSLMSNYFDHLLICTAKMSQVRCYVLWNFWF